MQIESSGNIIHGLQIISFSGSAIGLFGAYNIIGGNRSIGSGPLGQGNLLSGNEVYGVEIWGEDTSFNTIIGNNIGTDLSGVGPLANLASGVAIYGAHDNVIGPDNIIAHNDGDGIEIYGPNSLATPSRRTASTTTRARASAWWRAATPVCSGPPFSTSNLAAGTVNGSAVPTALSRSSPTAQTRERSTKARQ